MKPILAAFLLLIGVTSFAEDRPPNFILIFVDDMGWMDLSCQGSDFYQTPHIDRLASGGIRFTDGYAACAVCSPTRAAVQTGRHPHRLGVTDWIRSRFQRGNLGTPEANPTEYVGSPKRKLLCPPNPFWMEHEEITIAEALRQNSYQTAYIGKWHLGDPDWFPEHQGYVENRGGCDYGQPPSYFDPFNQPKGRHETLREGIYMLPGRNPGEYLTAREADEAVALIEQWKDEPFFIQLSHYAVHTPIQATDEMAAKYKDSPGATQKNAKYAAMVQSVDDSTGKLLAALEKHGIDDNTVILFTSDNGGLDNKNNPTDNAPLRSGKGYAYEGGIRVPFIVRWPGQIPAGAVSNTPVTSVDIFPTFLDLAGVEKKKGHQIDGLSLAEHLKSGGKARIDREDLIWHFPHYRHAPGPYSILRKGNWKLIKWWEGGHELYDLKNDLSEENNLAPESPETVKKLDDWLVKLLEKSEAKFPRPNPQYQAAKN
jgi:arylsulfatase A-like enzyme